MYGLKPVPFKDGTLLFLGLWSTDFAVISVHQRGTEITVNGVWPIQEKRSLGSPSLFRPRYSGLDIFQYRNIILPMSRTDGATGSIEASGRASGGGSGLRANAGSIVYIGCKQRS
jgi:hypothetical protein